MADNTLSISPRPASELGFRLGGAPLTGGVIARPVNPIGQTLRLVASLPAAIANKHCGLPLPIDHVVSVFSTWSASDYFLEHITYAGDDVELAHLRTGFTRTLVHARGTPDPHPVDIAPWAVDVGQGLDGVSRIGGRPDFLQKNPLALDPFAFAFQFYGGLVPKPNDDLLFLSDAVGYVFLPRQFDGQIGEGLFFVQAN